MIENEAAEESSTDGTVDDAQVERQRLRRQQGRKLLYSFGWIQVVEGVVACVLGIATIVFSAPTLTFTFLMGTQMWCGVILLSAGFLGVRASKYQDLPDGGINTRAKSIIVMHYSWTIIAFIPALLILLYAVVVLALCNRAEPLNTKTACFALDNIQTGLGITNVTVGTILSATIIPFMVFVCVLCRSYTPQDKTRAQPACCRDPPPAAGTVLEDAVRRQSHIIRQQQEQIELLSQRQHAMEQRIQASQMPLEAPPPYQQDDPPVVEIQKTPPPYKHLAHTTSCVETV